MNSEEKRYLTLEDIEAADDVQEEDVEVPEWGGPVRVRGFTKDVEMACREEAKDEDGDVDRNKLEMLFLVHGVINPPLTPSAVKVLEKKSAGACNKILRVIMRLNGEDKETIDKREQEFREESRAPLSVLADGDVRYADAEGADAAAPI